MALRDISSKFKIQQGGHTKNHGIIWEIFQIGIWEATRSKLSLVILWTF